MDVLDVFSSVQSSIGWVLLVGSLGVKAFAMVDAVRVPAPAFASAGKQTKNLWLLILGIALAVNIVVLNPISLLNIVGVVAAVVYLVDVRPAVRAAGGGRQGRSQDGPYGPW